MIFDGVREVAQRAKIDVAVIHARAVRFPWLTGPARYTFNAAEAVEVARLTNARNVIALHTSGGSHFREARQAARGFFQCRLERAAAHPCSRHWKIICKPPPGFAGSSESLLF